MSWSKQQKGLNQQKGLGLLEAILALVIGMFVIALSIQQYLSYRRDADVRQLNNNVDVLFMGMENYFKSNCASGQFASGTVASLPVTIDTLINGGFLTAWPNKKVPVNPLVDAASIGQGYILQFNQFLTGGARPQRMQEMSPVNGTTVADKPLGSIAIWQAQVAVKMFNTTTVGQYARMLGATCSSDLSGTTVTSCTAIPANYVGTYVVFQRAASSTAGDTKGSYWLAMPPVKQFTQMYRTEPILLLLSGANVGSQYFVCGS